MNLWSVILCLLFFTNFSLEEVDSFYFIFPDIFMYHHGHYA